MEERGEGNRGKEILNFPLINLKLIYKEKISLKELA